MRNGAKTLTALVLAACAVVAQAGTVFTGTSKAGTTVSLNDTTSKRCDEMSNERMTWFYAEAQDNDGMVTMRGCWHAFDDKVTIEWMNNGQRFTANWTWDGLDWTAYGQRKYGGANKKQAGNQL